MFSSSDYRIDNADEILSPSIVLFRDVLDQNLDLMIRIAGTPSRLRPHCKTHKMLEVAKRELALGITKHKAATFAEAEMLADAGVRDIVFAYPIVGPGRTRAAAFLRKYPDCKLIVTGDDTDAIRALSESMSAAGSQIGMLLDVNSGQNRTGVPLEARAIELSQLIHDLPGLTFEGLHLYDGHVHQSSREERETAVREQWQHVCDFREQLEQCGLPVPRVLCGGTPTFPIYAEMDDPAIELSPGTCVLHDAGYGAAFADLAGFRPAALLLTRVISRPTERRVTFDLGNKAVAADPPSDRRVVFPAIPDAKAVLHNEEHLVIETENANDYHVGDWTLAIPTHVCPTIALHRDVTVIVDGHPTETWQVTARDRQLTI